MFITSGRPVTTSGRCLTLTSRLSFPRRKFHCRSSRIFRLTRRWSRWFRCIRGSTATNSLHLRHPKSCRCWKGVWKPLRWINHQLSRRNNPNRVDCWLLFNERGAKSSDPATRLLRRHLRWSLHPLHPTETVGSRSCKPNRPRSKTRRHPHNRRIQLTLQPTNSRKTTTNPFAIWPPGSRKSELIRSKVNSATTRSTWPDRRRPSRRFRLIISSRPMSFHRKLLRNRLRHTPHIRNSNSRCIRSSIRPLSSSNRNWLKFRQPVRRNSWKNNRPLRSFRLLRLLRSESWTTERRRKQRRTSPSAIKSFWSLRRKKNRRNRTFPIRSCSESCAPHSSRNWSKNDTRHSKVVPAIQLRPIRSNRNLHPRPFRRLFRISTTADLTKLIGHPVVIRRPDRRDRSLNTAPKWFRRTRNFRSTVKCSKATTFRLTELFQPTDLVLWPMDIPASIRSTEGPIIRWTDTEAFRLRLWWAKAVGWPTDVRTEWLLLHTLRLRSTIRLSVPLSRQRLVILPTRTRRTPASTPLSRRSNSRSNTHSALIPGRTWLFRSRKLPPVRL